MADAPDRARPMPVCGSLAALQQVFRSVRIGSGEPNGDETGSECRLKRSADGLLPRHGAVGWAVRLQIRNVGRNLEVKVRRISRNRADLIHLVETQAFDALCLDEVDSVRPFFSPPVACRRGGPF